MKHQESEEIIKLISMIAYITRKDSPFILYEYYISGHSPLEIYNQEYNSSIKTTIPSASQDKIISSDELVQILSQLIELQQAGTKIGSKRIPLLSSEYKFKGYRQVEFSYADSNGLHVITITNKKKEIYFKHIIEKGAGE